ncbi:MAG: hypothetical protein U0V73_01815 [Acidimicrobiia bacterium]
MVPGRKLAGLVGLVAAVYVLMLRPRLVRWGATDEEVARPYPGADLVPEGQRVSTMAVTIDAPSAAVWPWLVQMGWGRAGWYSWDRLDNGGRPSARELHPEWQQLSVGDVLPAWSPGGPVDAWQVAALEPGRFLGLRGLTDLRGRVLDPARPRPPAYVEGLWGFLLEEEGEPGRTRLVVGGYQTIRPRWLERLLDYWFYPPVHWIMQVRQFADLKRNAEAQRDPRPDVYTDTLGR